MGIAYSPTQQLSKDGANANHARSMLAATPRQISKSIVVPACGTSRRKNDWL